MLSKIKKKWFRAFKKRYLFVFVFGISCLSLYKCTLEKSNPFAKYDICFKQGSPGATDRHVTYTPVRCSDPNIVLGYDYGGEYATLSFKDVDNDRVSEIIISSEFWCTYGLELCVYPARTTIKIKLDNPPKFEIFEKEELTHLKS